LAALCWVLGLSLRGTSGILSVWHSLCECLSNPHSGLPLPVELSHTSVWNDLQALSARLKRQLPCRVRVLAIDWVYPKLCGQECPTLIAVDLGSGQPVALGAIHERDWRAVVKWLKPLVEELGVDGNCEAIPKALLRNARDRER
jgi:hypothetical protein